MLVSYTAIYNAFTELLASIGTSSTMVSNAERLGLIQHLTTQKTIASEKYFYLLI